MSVSDANSVKSSSIVPAGDSGIAKRSHQVKVTLNHAELELLDHYVAQLGSDRSSTFRHLLQLFTSSETAPSTNRTSEGSRPSKSTEISGMLINPSEYKNNTKITFVEPEKFHDGKVLQAMECIVNKRVVIAGLVMMEPDQAQRAVDYLAGATEALKGHCERIAQSTFVFTPSGMPIEFGDSNPSSDADKIDVREPSPPLLTGLNE
jgi:FtsZ-interacting cell division protein YlmF